MPTLRLIRKGEQSVTSPALRCCDWRAPAQATANRQAERLMMMQELTRLAIESLPCSTDSDVPLALLNGMQEILSADAENMRRLFESFGSKAAHASLIEVAHA